MTTYRLTALAVAIGVALIAAPVAAQDDVPRTAWGQPDLTGVWDYRSITRMERPEQFADQEFLTEEEVADLEQQALDRLNNFLNLPAQRTVAGENVDRRPDGGNGSYNHTWLDQGLEAVTTGRTSLIVDPPTGRYPPRTAEGQARAEAYSEHRRNQPADSWLDFSTYDRCILGFNAGPPMTPSAYNNNMQLFQTPDTVALVTEMVNTVRVVPLDGRPMHDLLQWSGESRGHWDGDTLVIETANFDARRQWRTTSGAMRLTERLTRVDAETLLYEATIDDPETWTAPWTFEVPMKFLDGEKWEYACHEGHVSMPIMLGGARVLEAAAGGGQ
ncbi:MAG: hypothetical protein F4Y45_18145 [Acidobacteria bacterium]|nr:hypothetical protein [Acidobacteriota bacterium]MXZ73320.1 hypothetical protein [Acidobacteriota bacterium]MYD72617.1 hypothetical protein [Acidobacteriota bacterium]MYJ05273.1 hypothetical protein [Acidobacteriota bacterium]